jgi:starvation-inducible outer membrane lipoprotein
VTGEVSDSITLSLDETDYTYPVIDIKRVQVWAGPEDVARRTNPYYYMGPGPWGRIGAPTGGRGRISKQDAENVPQPVLFIWSVWFVCSVWSVWFLVERN